MKLKTLILAACFAIMAVVTMTPTTAEAAVCPRPVFGNGGKPLHTLSQGNLRIHGGVKSVTLPEALAAGTGR